MSGNKVAALLYYWFPPIALMVLIFYLSSRSTLPDFESFDLAMKKGAHLTVYAVLYFLLFRAFYASRPEQGPLSPGTAFYAAAIAVLYAISDEVHQSFVPFREATVRDVLIDTAGIALMGLIMRAKPGLFTRLLRGLSLR
jgi:hypothetical protein